MMIFKRNKILSFNFISIPPDCLDISRTLKRVIHLLPQVADMHCYGIIALAEILITPDLMEQFLRAHHFSLLPAQNLQDRKFCRCQGKRFFIQCAFMCPDIQHKAGMLQNICIRCITGVVPLSLIHIFWLQSCSSM